MEVNTLGDLCNLLTTREMFIGTYIDKKGIARPQVSVKADGKLFFLNKDFKTGKISCKKAMGSVQNNTVPLA